MAALFIRIFCSILTVLKEEIMTDQHRTQYRKDYQSPTYTIETIDLEFTLHDTQTRVSAVSKVKRLVEDVAAPLVLDGEHLSLFSLKVNGDDYKNYQLTNTQLVLSGLPKDFELSIVSEIAPADNTALEGLYKSAGAYCTQCEAQGFRRITWFLDRPDVLAKYTTKIIADKTDYPYLLSNGNEIGRGELEDGLHWVQWQDPFPKPSYLFALVAGQFDLLKDSFTSRSGREVALELFVEPGNSSKGQHALDSLKKAMAWDESRFNLEYDLDIYMIVAVDFFNMGAMENKGLNVFNAKYVLADPSTATDQDFLNIEAVIGHEYFHNWTGNRVTCRDWFQLSLKEGLTVFRDQEFSSDLGSRTVNRIQSVRTMRGPQFAEDAGPMAHPIRPDEVMEMNNFYTVTVYNKGSEVIRMIHTLLGEQQFMQGIALYLNTFDGQAATCEDFIQCMEKASAKDLGQFRLWYSTAGTPQLQVSELYDPKKQSYKLTISQLNKAMPVMHIPIDLELIEFDGKTIKSSKTLLELTDAEQVFTFEGHVNKPVPALLREFSAPVRLMFGLEDEALAMIIANASNKFNRWDAAQQLYLLAIDKGLKKQGQVELSTAGVKALNDLLTKAEDFSVEHADPYFISALLSLPTESEIAQNYAQVDIEAINSARKALFDSLSGQLYPLLEKAYKAKQSKVYCFEQASIGERAFNNCALNYLAQTEPKLVELQYDSADNMTDTLAALHAANQHNLPCLGAMMNDFESRWHHDPLVMDKWLMLKAIRPGVSADEIRAVMEHPAFSISNPNRVRSLIGSFANNNPMAFHDISGCGYRLLRDIIEQLNTINPQVAARMIDPLLRFKRYDDKRQELMKQSLEHLSGLEGLSRDLFEKISKALA